MNSKQAVIFIDTESGLEGPWREYHDFEEGIRQIIKVLDRYRVPAVFNACGKLIESYPGVFQQLVQSGHEVALHGWKHENLRLLDNEWLDRVMSRSHKAYQDVLGGAPHGFRAPWLDYDDRLLGWLSQKNYKWVSHRHMFYRERFVSPAARPEIRSGRGAAALWAKWQESRFDKMPHENKAGLLEIPLTSSMDGELLGLTSPLQPSPARVMDFAVNAWHRQMKRAPMFFSLNLHDWLVASANRLDLLNKMTTLLLENGYKIITANQCGK
jgi:peptidoglycan/xylan/chitin deacetylase (PgdA/CDA1 family)